MKEEELEALKENITAIAFRFADETIASKGMSLKHIVTEDEGDMWKVSFEKVFVIPTKQNPPTIIVKVIKETEEPHMFSQ